MLLYHKTIGKMVIMAELQLCTNLVPSIPLTILLALITILLVVVLSTPTPLCFLLLFTTHQFLPSTAFRVMCSTRVFYHILVDLLLGILMALFVFAATLIPQISVGRLIPLSDYSNSIIDLFEQFNGLQIVENSTHINGKILDIFVTNCPNVCSVFLLYSTFCSDHYPISINIHNNYNERESSSCDVPVYSKGSFNLSNCDLGLIYFNNFLLYYYQMDAQPFFDSWYKILINAVYMSVNVKHKKRQLLPFYFSSHSVHVTNMVATEKRRLESVGLLSSHKLGDLQATLMESVDHNKLTLISIFETLDTNNCYKLPKNLSGGGMLPAEITYTSVKASNDHSKANLFNTFLSSVFQQEWFFTPIPEVSEDTCIKLDAVNFSSSDVELLLKKIPDTASVAADGIPPFIIRNCANILAQLVYVLFTCIVSTRLWPNIWKQAHVIPFFKSGSKIDVCNYKGISILPRLSLVLEKILFNFVYNRVRDELSNAQHGLRCRRSTFTLLLDYIDKVYSSCDGNIDYNSVYFDVQKLLFKLRAFGFNDAFFELLSSYLSGSTQRVGINTYLSSGTAVPSGVPQGSILGPLLILIFINDLPDCVKSSSCYLFADDLKLFSKFSHELFQNDINSVASWVKYKGLIFHPSKTVLLTNVTNSQFFLNDTAIKI